MQAPYAQAIAGGDGVTVIASTAGGIPSFAWSSDGLSWQQGEVPASRDGAYEFVSGLAYRSGTWLAVGAGGLVLRSEDSARSWQRMPHALERRANFAGVIATDSGFLGFGRQWSNDDDGTDTGGAGIFFTNDNGQTWKETRLPLRSGLSAAAVLGDTWIVAGEEGTLCRSKDAGSGWEILTLNTIGNFHSIAAGNGVFVLVGPNGLVLRSTDLGRSWEEVFPGNSEWISGVVFAEGVFVLSGGNSTTAGAISADGKIWTPAARIGAWGTPGWGPSGFLAVGGTYGWQTTASAPPALRKPPSVLRAIAGRPFRFRLQSTMRGADYASSALPAGLVLDSRSGWMSGRPSVTGNFPVHFYATRNGTAGDAKTVLLSINDPLLPPGQSLIWKNHPTALSGAGFQPVALDFSGTAFVAVGETAEGRPMIARSTDGRSWSFTAVPPGTPLQDSWGMLQTIACSGTTWLAAGVGPTLWKSSDDGQTWVAQPPATFGLPDLRGLAAGDSFFVAVGAEPAPEGGERASIFYSSNSGLEWSRAEIRSGESRVPPLRALARSGGFWVAVGERGTLLRASHPSGPWLPVESGTLQTLRTVSAAGPVVVAAGEAGILVRSSDHGATWSAGASGAGYWPGPLTNFNGLFVFTGGELAAGSSSRDGLNWLPPRSGAAYGPAAVGMNQFVSLTENEVWIARGPWAPAVLPVSPPLPAHAGVAYSWQPIATGAPSRWLASGLPPGLKIHPANGTIEGTPTRPGKFTIRIRAGNSAGLSAPRAFQLTVNSKP